MGIQCGEKKNPFSPRKAIENFKGKMGFQKANYYFGGKHEA